MKINQGNTAAERGGTANACRNILNKFSRLLVQVNTCGAQRCWGPLALGRQRKREHSALKILEASDLSLQVAQYLLAKHQHGNRIIGFERLFPWSGLYPLKKIEQLNFFFPEEN